AWLHGASMVIHTRRSHRRCCVSPTATKTRPSIASFARATEEVPPVDDRIVHMLPVVSIQPSPHNPRHQTDNIDELAQSLRTHGLLQPVVVRRRGGSYELIVGHRRYEAAKLLGWSEI